MNRTERRMYKRLQIKFPISCQKIGSTNEKPHKGYTINISSGGLFFQTPTKVFKQGNLLKFELSIPPTSGILESGGKMEGYASVLRICNIQKTHKNKNSTPDIFGVAIQFCQPPKLCM